MLDFDKTDLRDNILIVTNDDGSITCIPEDGATTDEQALFSEFRAEYPDGKPVAEVAPQVAEPSELDRIKALEDALLMML